MIHAFLVPWSPCPHFVEDTACLSWPRGREAAIDIPLQPYTYLSWTFHSFISVLSPLILSMDPSVIDLTVEVRKCKRCKVKWANVEPAERALWKSVLTGSKERALVCSICFSYYREKMAPRAYIHYFCPCTRSNPFTETVTNSSSSARTTGQTIPVRKLVADSQRGIGMNK